MGVVSQNEFGTSALLHNLWFYITGNGTVFLLNRLFFFIIYRFVNGETFGMKLKRTQPLFSVHNIVYMFSSFCFCLSLRRSSKYGYLEFNSV